MPGKSIVASPCDVIYVYDGSLDGFFCCVYESIYKRQMPYSIVPESLLEPSLIRQIYIDTDGVKAQKVRQSVPYRICPRALELIESVFLSCLPEKELAMLRFLILGYNQGKKAAYMLGHPDVAPLLKAEQQIGHEAHLLTGFVRFSDYDGFLASTISPKNFVLPLLVKHFTIRYSCENFIIYDDVHKAALIYENKNAKIIPLEHIEFPAVSQEEEKYRSLWKQFYNTIAIQARENSRCRMTHMPKRYWHNMTEVKDLL